MVRRVALFSLVVFAAGCGGGARGDEGKIRDVVARFSTAFADKDYGTVCDLLTTQAKEQLLKAALFTGGGGDCPTTLRKLGSFVGKNDVEKLRHIRIMSITVRGTHATVRTSADNGSPTRLLKDDSGDWLVDADPGDG